MTWRSVRRVATQAKRSAHFAIARNANRPGYRHLIRLADGIVRAANNDSGDMSRNGERWLLERLACVLPPAVVIDVGANRGQWSLEVRRACPMARIHAFEPSSATRALMSPILIADPLATIVPLALSDHRGSATLHRDPDHSEMASLVSKGQVETEVVQLTTGDDYLSEHNIDHVGLLKVDTEGHDLAVLRGFSGALSAGAVDVVQFEFTLWAAVSRTWLADFYDLLIPFGYTIGKLFPDRIAWSAYSPSHEYFGARANYVATRQAFRPLLEP